MERNYTVKPIPTVYNNVQFRSRLEARWAVFFDTLGIPYCYEYEGFQLESGWYLPDFWMPGLNAWIEIKPSEFTDSEKSHCEELAIATRKNVYMMFGDLSVPEYSENSCNVWFGDGGWDNYQFFCECPKCGTIGIEYGGRAARICGNKCFPKSDREHNHDSKRLVGAYTKAQQYQFLTTKQVISSIVPMANNLSASSSPHTIFIPSGISFQSLKPTLPGVDNDTKKWLTLYFERSNDTDRDRKRLIELHATLTSYPGNDGFTLVLIDKHQEYLMEFPNHRTSDCEPLRQQLIKMLGATNVVVLEHRDFGKVQP